MAKKSPLLTGSAARAAAAGPVPPATVSRPMPSRTMAPKKPAAAGPAPMARKPITRRTPR